MNLVRPVPTSRPSKENLRGRAPLQVSSAPVVVIFCSDAGRFPPVDFIRMAIEARGRWVALHAGVVTRHVHARMHRRRLDFVAAEGGRRICKEIGEPECSVEPPEWAWLWGAAPRSRVMEAVLVFVRAALAVPRDGSVNHPRSDHRRLLRHHNTTRGGRKIVVNEAGFA
jgi:hypothetical protein